MLKFLKTRWKALQSFCSEPEGFAEYWTQTKTEWKQFGRSRHQVRQDYEICPPHFPNQRLAVLRANRDKPGQTEVRMGNWI